MDVLHMLFWVKEARQKKNRLYDSINTKCLEKTNLEIKSRLAVPQGQKLEWGMTANMHEVSFQGDGSVLRLDYDIGSITLKIQSHLFLHLKMGVL